ncbi:MAG: hypothetical protein KME43_20050 [Myxacorys chilensis ATA2-1-KO14]|jgi:hypothetical protein|nr:hypothetical protein [Myxacorys chilensis ATA2-1-KO14]
MGLIAIAGERSKIEDAGERSKIEDAGERSKIEDAGERSKIEDTASDPIGLTQKFLLGALAQTKIC